MLLPLLDDCQDVINSLFDNQDGVEDGEFQPLSDAYDQCAAVPPATLIDELKALQDRGQCPPTVLDSVVATEVKAPPFAIFHPNAHGANRQTFDVANPTPVQHVRVDMETPTFQPSFREFLFRFC
eukprot:SAG31_NODE_11696_length_1005_cov_7.190949_1_plen_125_part_00